MLRVNRFPVLLLALWTAVHDLLATTTELQAADNLLRQLVAVSTLTENGTFWEVGGLRVSPTEILDCFERVGMSGFVFRKILGPKEVHHLVFQYSAVRIAENMLAEIRPCTC